jgi:hypothetical protein
MSATSRFDLKWCQRHDQVNYICLTIVISLNIYFLVSPTVEKLQLYSRVFVFYLLADFVWILLLPQSVSSPSFILVHHVATSVAIASLPVMDFELGKLGALACLVEVNTFARLLRKVYRDSELINFMFYASWVFSRLIVGPYTLYQIGVRLAYPHAHKPSWLTEDASFRLNMVLFSVGAVLNILNFKWSYDLFVLGGSRHRDRKGL